MPNRDLAARDHQVLWHPCTQMRDHEWLPMVPIVRGAGVWLYDADGKPYLDAISSWWVNVLGHSEPRLNAALAAQASKLEHVIFAGFTHEPAIELAEALIARAPTGLRKVIYADSGSAASEIALKLSHHYWRNLGKPQKQRFLCLADSYHGETLGALGVTDIALYRESYGPLMQQATVLPSPGSWQPAMAQSRLEHEAMCLRAAQDVLERDAGHIAALIIEPLVQGAGGMRMHRPEYVHALRELTRAHDVLLIADEIAVGMGRTGTLFACEQADVCPDMLLLGKGLSGGYLPLSAVLTTQPIYDAFYDDYQSLKAFLHSHSFSGNPLACALALKTLEIFDSDQILPRVAAIGARMDQALAPLAEHPNVLEYRRTGAIAALELCRDKATGAAFDWRERRGLAIYQHALERGALLRPLGHVLYLMPPYVISDAQIDWLADIAAGGIERAVSAPAQWHGSATTGLALEL